TWFGGHQRRRGRRCGDNAPGAIVAMAGAGGFRWDRGGRRHCLSVSAPADGEVAFLAIIAASGRLVPSPVDKTTMNLWHRQLEFYGEKIPNIEGSNVALHLGGLRMAEDAPEDYYDYAVPRSKGVSAWSYLL